MPPMTTMEYAHKELELLARYGTCSGEPIRCNWKVDYSQADVTFVAVARTGSTSLQRAIENNARFQPVMHTHRCTLEDLENQGARRVVLAMRDPVARLVSGVHRQLDLAAGGANSTSAHEFWRILARLGYNNAADASNTYLDALRSPQHPLHGTAREAACQGKFMRPLVAYYLRGARGLARVGVICTSSLEAGFNALARRWNMTRPMTEHLHNSDDPRRRLADMPAPSRHVAHAAGSGSINCEHARWLRHFYANDARLTARCNETSFRYGWLTIAGPDAAQKARAGRLSTLELDGASRFEVRDAAEVEL
jgi:hypothetical protein